MPSFVATHAESGRSKENELLSEVYVVAASVCAVLSLWAVVCFVVSVSDAFFWQPFIINIAAIPITSNVAIFFLLYIKNPPFLSDFQCVSSPLPFSLYNEDAVNVNFS